MMPPAGSAGRQRKQHLHQVHLRLERRNLEVINYAPDGTTNSSFVYTYNDLDQCTTMTTVDGRWVYTYDAIGQLTQAVFTPNSATPMASPAKICSISTTRRQPHPNDH